MAVLSYEDGRSVATLFVVGHEIWERDQKKCIMMYQTSCSFSEEQVISYTLGISRDRYLTNVSIRTQT